VQWDGAHVFNVRDVVALTIKKVKKSLKSFKKDVIFAKFVKRKDGVVCAPGSLAHIMKKYTYYGKLLHIYISLYIYM
jgi:hypothetical protein